MSAADQNLKYRLTNESRQTLGVTVYRIQALRDIEIDLPGVRRRVRAGELGGFVMSERNLSQTGQAWVADQALVIQHAHVGDDALLEDKAVARNWAQVQGKSRICGQTHIAERLQIKDLILLRGAWSRPEDIKAYREFSLLSNRYVRANASRLARLAMTHLQSDEALMQWHQNLQNMLPQANWTHNQVAARAQCLESLKALKHDRVEMRKVIEQMRGHLDLAYGSVLRELSKQLASYTKHADLLVDDIALAIRYNRVLDKAGLDEGDFRLMATPEYNGPDVLDADTE